MLLTSDQKRWHSSPPVGPPWDSPPPPPESVRASGRAYADVTTKISRIDRLPDLVSSAIMVTFSLFSELTETHAKGQHTRRQETQ